MLRWGLLAMLLFGLTELTAQDTTRVRPQTLAYATPALLIVSGTIMNKDATKQGVRDWIRRRYDIPKTTIDDILQHAPILMIYGTDLALGQDKSTIGRHTRHLITTQALTLGTMLLSKAIFNNKRPNGGSHAFPSGHTAYAFASAGVMYHSFKEEHPLIAYSGYVPAIVVGAYRMIKDKHWISDVFVGAGMGLLFSHLTYDIDLWHSRTNRPMDQKSNVSIRLGTTADGVGLAVRF